LNSGGTKFRKPVSANFWIGIGHAGDYTADSGGDQSVCARGRSALVGVWFESDVKGAAAGIGSGLFEGKDLCVFDAVIGMDSGTDDVASGVSNDGAYVWIGRG
jgi:hypothetical protein